MKTPPLGWRNDSRHRVSLPSKYDSASMISVCPEFKSQCCQKQKKIIPLQEKRAAVEHAEKILHTILKIFY
jgi:hypothetical protein